VDVGTVLLVPTTKIEDNAMAFVRRPDKYRQVVSFRLAGLRRILGSANGSSSVWPPWHCTSVALPARRSLSVMSGISFMDDRRIVCVQARGWVAGQYIVKKIANFQKIPQNLPDLPETCQK